MSFAFFDPSKSHPALNAAEVTPSDSTNLTRFSRAVYVGSPGSLRVTMVNDQVVNFAGLVAGSLLPICVQRVHATGTTAANIVVVW